MDFELELYFEYVIKPLEEEIKHLISKIYSKNPIDWLCRGIYKDYLNKYNQMLYEKYTEVSNIIEQHRK